MNTIGRLALDKIDPAFLPPVPSSYRPGPKYNINQSSTEVLHNFHKDPKSRPPEYYPQPEDYLTRKSKAFLGPLDYNASGRTDYNLNDDLTGVRPVVDQYSITRYSLNEWRKENQNLVRESQKEQKLYAQKEWDVLTSFERIKENTDKIQADNTNRTLIREKQIFRWKAELENCIELMMNEIELVERERERLKNSLIMVVVPASVASECIYRRTSRLEKDLVRDEVEDELAKELSLTSEIELRLKCVLREIERQLIENRGAKERMEFDWCDKKIAFEIEEDTLNLNNQSDKILFHSGIDTFPGDQSTPNTWDNFVQNIIIEAEIIRKKSKELRKTLDAILTNAARDLRTQADVVEKALLNRITATEGIFQELTFEIKQIMRKIVEAEDLIPNIKKNIRRLDFPMKTAQSRLYNKSLRPRIENCRDPPQHGLIEEIRNINESISELQAQLNHIEESRSALLLVRSNLEREIKIKQKTLEIDRTLYREVRTKFPSVNALTGYID